MKFTELNEEQKAKAIEKHRHINVYDGWDEFLADDFKEKMEPFGFSDIEISSDTSFCQGSGASFTCSDIDLMKYLTSTKQLSLYRSIKKMIQDREITGSISRISHSYNHSNTIACEIKTCYDVSKVQYNLMQALQDDIIEFVRRECDAFHRELETNYLQLVSDKDVEETIIANEIEFAIKEPNVDYL